MDVTDEKAEEIYLDWFNNYLTVAKFAEIHNLSYDKAYAIIIRGMEIHHAK